MHSREAQQRGRSARDRRAAVVAVGVVLALTGCIPGLTVREGFGDLRVLSESGGTELDVLGEPYTKGRHGHLIFETMAPDALDDRLGAELRVDGPTFDVVALDDAGLGKYASGLADLGDQITRAVREDLFPAVLDAARVDGRYVGMPLWADTEILYYRSDLFGDPAEQAAFEDAYGYPLEPPGTWQQYRDVAEFFTRDVDGDGTVDLYGTDLVGAAPTQWLASAAQAGAAALVLDGNRVVVDDGAHVAALDFHRDLARFAPGNAAHLDAAGVRILFLQGSLAMMRFRASGYPQLPPVSPVSGDVAVAPQIAGPAGIAGVPRTLFAAVPAAAKNTDAALDFVAAAFTENERMLTTPPRLPARMSVLEARAATDGFEHFASLLATLRSPATRPLPATEHWQEIVDAVLVPTLQRAIAGNVESQLLLAEAKTEIERILSAPVAGD